MLYWRVTINAKTTRAVIGNYDSKAPPKSLTPTAHGYSAQAAIRAAEALAQRHHANRDDGGYAALRAKDQAAKRLAVAAMHEADQHTLQNLLGHYTDHLKTLERKSYRDASSIFALHVIEPWPKVAALPASQVTGEQIADMMRRVLDLGKGRTANKLRSYMRAAYQTAKASRSKPSIPTHFKAYNITANPASDTEPDESQNKPAKNPLSPDDLRRYWQAIKSIPGFKGAVLRLHLLTGGQRIEQLVSLKTTDMSGKSILLYDGKGRPGRAPRPHVVPLLPAAISAIKEIKPSGLFAISTDGGATHLAATTLSAWAVEAAKDIGEFQAKRIRSGVETMLSAAKVSKDTRGRLQSHGIAGVQDRHYDGHDYLDEKLMALKKLHALLRQPPKNNAGTSRKAPKPTRRSSTPTATR